MNHLIVCGHYGCGGVKAAMSDAHHGLIDNWVRTVKDKQQYFWSELAACKFRNSTMKNPPQ